MNFSINFFVTSVLLGLGLAIDGFLLSLTNGLNYNKTTKLKTIFSATIFALFQLMAVMIGWFCVAKLINNLKFIEDIISIIALVVLTALGTKMIVNGAKSFHKERLLRNTMQEKTKEDNKTQNETINNTMQSSQNLICSNSNINSNNLVDNNINCENVKNINKQKNKKGNKTWLGALLLQALITSVDALSVGFVVSKNPFVSAFVTAIIISFVTFTMYLFGFSIGKKFGEKIGSKAEILGGIVLIIIGIEIFVTSLIN